jgi:hypothetical protein
VISSAVGEQLQPAVKLIPSRKKQKTERAVKKEEKHRESIERREKKKKKENYMKFNQKNTHTIENVYSLNAR